MPTPGHLTIPEVCEITGLTPATLYWYRHTDSGPPCYKIGGKQLLYPIPEFERWFNGRIATTLRGTVFPGRPPKLPPSVSPVSSIHRGTAPLSESL
jgi:predicted DNA-binding transcriptional regulator AlpA